MTNTHLKEIHPGSSKLMIAAAVVAAMAVGIAVSMSASSVGGSLKRIYDFGDYYTEESLAPLTAGPLQAAILNNQDGEVASDLFSIEPDRETIEGTDYTNVRSYHNPDVEGVIYAFHIDMVKDPSNALDKYLGAQLAVYAQLKNDEGALDGLKVTEKNPDAAKAAIRYAKKYVAEAADAYAANETAKDDPYSLSSEKIDFTLNSSAVRFVNDPEKILYFRSEPVHLNLNGDQDMMAQILSSVSYTVTLVNAPEGTFVGDINGNRRDTFVPAQSFRIYSPAAATAGHSPMRVQVTINQGYTAWSLQKWNSFRSAEYVGMKAVEQKGKKLTLPVTFPEPVIATEEP